MGRNERITNAWRIGPYVISEIEGHGWPSIPGPIYRFEIDGQERNHEAYETLDHALASAIGERWTGRRGAGGFGVDMAAGWFMRMIGAHGIGTRTGESVEVTDAEGRKVMVAGPAHARRVPA